MKNTKYFLFDFILILLWSVLFMGTYALVTQFMKLNLSAIWLFPVTLLSAFCVLCLISLVLPAPREGRHKFNSLEATYWFIQFQFARVWRYPPIYHFVFSLAVLRWIFFKCNGAKIAFSSSISSLADIHDLYLLEIQDEAIVGMHATVVAHYIIGDSLIIGAVKIGAQTTIGAHVMIGPNTTIGNQCLLEAKSVIMPRTKMKDGARLRYGDCLKGDKIISWVSEEKINL